MPIDPTDLLDQPPLRPEELTRIEDLARAVMASSHDVVVLQGEAILALEAVARSVGAPGRTALNVVTGPYGAGFGNWMREAGADVVDVACAFDTVIDADAVATAIREHAPALLSIVHAEAATGGTNPIEAVLRVAREAGVLTIVDAVASIGAEPVLVDEWGIDIAVIGGQKSLAGPAGVSAVSMSAAAWAMVDATPGAPRDSSLSLLDVRERWLRTDRSMIPGMPSWLESRAFAAAAERVLAEGLPSVNERHRRARAATLAGAARLGVSPWQGGDLATLAPVVTALRLPPAGALGDGSALGGILSAGNGSLRGQVLRVNHTGRAAALEPVLDALARIAAVLGIGMDDARAAAAEAWAVGSAPRPSHAVGSV